MNQNFIYIHTHVFLILLLVLLFVFILRGNVSKFWLSVSWNTFLNLLFVVVLPLKTTTKLAVEFSARDSWLPESAGRFISMLYISAMSMCGHVSCYIVDYVHHSERWMLKVPNKSCRQEMYSLQRIGLLRVTKIPCQKFPVDVQTAYNQNSHHTGYVELC